RRSFRIVGTLPFCRWTSPFCIDPKTTYGLKWRVLGAKAGMTVGAEYRVFISAVTSEFEKARQAIASDLRSRGLRVEFQDDFRHGQRSGTTLERLHDYIRSCDRAVFLIGKRSGDKPPEVAEQFRDMLRPSGLTEASY